jgi:hypothetical protein
MAGDGPLDLDEGEPGLGLVDLPDVQSLVILDALLHLVRTESLRCAPVDRYYINIMLAQRGSTKETADNLILRTCI